MTTRKAFTPAELRELAKEPYDFHHPHLLDAMRGALLFCADVIDAANEALRVSGSDASPAPGRAPLTDEQIVVLRHKMRLEPHQARASDLAFARAIESAHGIAPAGGIGGE